LQDFACNSICLEELTASRAINPLFSVQQEGRGAAIALALAVAVAAAFVFAVALAAS
jgi:hypothetical protein